MRTTADKLIKLLVTGVVIFISFTATWAAPVADALWTKANELYKQRQYDSALACFEQVAASRPGVPEVYYNIGNTYYKLNKIGPAVLYYEKALQLRPSYKEAQENLAITQNRINNHIRAIPKVFFVRWWHSLTAAPLADLWAGLALGIFAGMILLFIANKLKTGVRILPPQVTGVLVLAWICTLVLAYFSGRNSTASNIAVVMHNDAHLMMGGDKSKAEAVIPEGTTVNIKSIKGEYAEVTLPDGRRGWMQLSLIKSIDKI